MKFQLLLIVSQNFHSFQLGINGSDMFFGDLASGPSLNNILNLGSFMKLLNCSLGIKDQKLFQRDQIIQQNNLITNLFRICLILDNITINASNIWLKCLIYVGLVVWIYFVKGFWVLLGILITYFMNFWELLVRTEFVCCLNI